VLSDPALKDEMYPQHKLHPADRTGLGANRKTPERRVASVLSVSEAAKGGCKRYSDGGMGAKYSGAVGARVERAGVPYIDRNRMAVPMRLESECRKC
jgi:hypothetical protein